MSLMTIGALMLAVPAFGLMAGFIIWTIFEESGWKGMAMLAWIVVACMFMLTGVI